MRLALTSHTPSHRFILRLASLGSNEAVRIALFVFCILNFTSAMPLPLTLITFVI